MVKDVLETVGQRSETLRDSTSGGSWHGFQHNSPPFFPIPVQGSKGILGFHLLAITMLAKQF